MKILFLDQTGEIGGAELALADIAHPYRQDCLVGLFADGPFRHVLEQRQIPVQVLSSNPIKVSRESGWLGGLASLKTLMPLILQVASLSRQYDLIYANTQKAMVVGAIASLLGRRPLVVHLHDILSKEHFSWMNRRLSTILTNSFAALVIADSEATKDAFVQAGGRSDIAHVVYYGFDIKQYQQHQSQAASRQWLEQQIGVKDCFIVGHFGRITEWKGQHILIESLTQCPENVIAVFVGGSIFGSKEYVEQLYQKVTELGLEQRVMFLGFRPDVTKYMAGCDLVAHTSISPEPFGRVIVEGMLCGRPVVAAAAGGAVEIVEHDRTGWLSSPGDAQKLAEVINQCRSHPDRAATIAQRGQEFASQTFHIDTTGQKVAQLLTRVVKNQSLPQVRTNAVS